MNSEPYLPAKITNITVCANQESDRAFRLIRITQPDF